MIPAVMYRREMGNLSGLACWNRPARVNGLLFPQLKIIPCARFSGSVFGELAGEDPSWEWQPHYLQISS